MSNLEAQERAAKWQLANRSDPFAGRVALTHLLNGVASHNIDDCYTCEFAKTDMAPNNRYLAGYGLTIPTNMVRP